MSRWQQLAGVVILLGLDIAPLNAREAYLRDVPSPFACTTCHEDPRRDRQGANIRNGFGFDYVAQRQDWARLCALDSDGDGITNAIELLDPDCEWRPAPAGQPNTPRPAGQATHPGDPNDPDQCGDGEIQGREDCDTEPLDGASCESLGFLEGELRCDPQCQFDTTQCVPLPTPDMAFIQADSAVADMRLVDAYIDTLDVTFVHMDAHLDALDQAVTDQGQNPSDTAASDGRITPADIQIDSSVHMEQMQPAMPQPGSGCAQARTVYVMWCALLCVLAFRTRRLRRRI